MQNIPQEQVVKRFQLLPDVLKDAIFSEQTSGTIIKSCALRDVPEEKTPTVGQLAGRVLLGYLRPESFAFEIQKETGIDALKATQVAHDIDTEIFSAVRLELKKLYPPTIQTPTVQQPGFSGQESRIRNQESGTGFQDSGFKIQEQKPAPRYVVQIPERFKKPETRNLKPEIQDSRFTIQEQKPAPTPVPTTQSPEIQDSRFKIQEKQGPAPSPAAPQTQPNAQDSSSKIQEGVPPNEAKSYKLKADGGAPMDPIVPLPTFIQSKFKTDELGMVGQESRIRNQELGMEQQAVAPAAQPEIQDSRFKIQEKAPSTQDALKNAFGKFITPSTATGITKEPVSPYRETIEEPTKTPEQKPAAKIQGKVIDLSQF